MHGCLCPLSPSLSKDVGFGSSWHHGGEWHQGHHPAVEEHTTHHTEHHEFHTEQKDLPCPQFSYGWSTLGFLESEVLEFQSWKGSRVHRYTNIKFSMVRGGSHPSDLRGQRFHCHAALTNWVQPSWRQSRHVETTAAATAATAFCLRLQEDAWSPAKKTWHWPQSKTSKEKSLCRLNSKWSKNGLRCWKHYKLGYRLAYNCHIGEVGQLKSANPKHEIM